MIALQFWSAAAVLLLAFCYFYAEEVSGALDWLAWSCAAVVARVRMALWAAWLGPRLRLETWLRARRARARLRAQHKDKQHR